MDPIDKLLQTMKPQSPGAGASSGKAQPSVPAQTPPPQADGESTPHPHSIDELLSHLPGSGQSGVKQRDPLAEFKHPSAPPVSSGAGSGAGSGITSPAPPESRLDLAKLPRSSSSGPTAPLPGSPNLPKLDLAKLDRAKLDPDQLDRGKLDRGKLDLTKLVGASGSHGLPPAVTPPPMDLSQITRADRPRPTPTTSPLPKLDLSQIQSPLSPPVPPAAAKLDLSKIPSSSSSAPLPRPSSGGLGGGGLADAAFGEAKAKFAEQQRQEAEARRQEEERQQRERERLEQERRAIEERERRERERREQEQRAEAERLAQEKRKVLEKQAQQWLKQLDPMSHDGLWFDRFAENYDSRLDAAIDYLAVEGMS